MESKVKLFSFVRFAVHSLTALVLLALVAIPLAAGTVTVQSDANNLGATVDPNSPAFAQGNITGLTFTPVGIDNLGSFTSPPPGAPLGTLVVQVPPECGGGCGQSGFIKTTFTLPSSFSAISLTGAGNVDDSGYVFLNGNLISGPLSEFGNVAFSTDVASFFLPGVNTLVVSDNNSGGGPSGVAFYANVNYTTSATPEPASMIMLATGLVGLGGVIRRKLAL